ncbi:aminotransferase class IV [Nitratifractor sp.]
MSPLLFETIRCEGGEARHLEYHRRRMRRSVGRDFPLEELIAPPSGELLRCKVIYDHEGIRSIDYFPYTKRSIRTFRLLEADFDYSRKYLDRSPIDELFAQRGGADEILIVRKDLLTDTSIANIALSIEGRWLTPASPLLPGTTWERYLEKGILQPAKLTPSDLQHAEKLALFNAMIGFHILPDFALLP